MIPHLLLALALAAGLAGCANPEERPEDLQAPTWKVGDSWHYQRDDGAWRNQTVAVLEKKNGVDSYRLSVEYSKPNEIGSTSATVWIDQQSFGVIAFFERGQSGSMTPAIGQLFPMEERSYQSQFVASDGYKQTVDERLQVVGWERQATRAGTFDAMHLVSVQTSQGTTMERWYAPEVKNYVRELTDEDYKLSAWHTA